MTFVSHRKPDHPAWWRAFARWLFGLFGWKAVGEVPDLPKFVLIGAPHTSNWDGLLMVGITIILGFKMQWLGKHTLFKFPFGGFMRFIGGVPVYRIGGVPVYRYENRNMTGQAVDAFNAHERFIRAGRHPQLYHPLETGLLPHRAGGERADCAGLRRLPAQDMWTGASALPQR